MEMPANRSVYADYLFLLIGSGLMAFAIQTIYSPADLVTGGFTGVAIIVKSISGKWIDSGIPLWLTNTILNIPLFIAAIRIKGVRFLGRTGFATLALSVWLYLIPDKPMMTDDLVLASLFGGAISGAGMGLVFLARGTTGGTDMLAVLVQHYMKHYTIAQVMQVIDAAVVLAGAFLFGISNALYAVIAIIVVSRITDGIIEGLKFSKVAYIITDRYEEVAAAIMKETNRGATGLIAKGMYSGKYRNMLFCVVSKKEIVLLKEIVINTDPDAFVIVTDAREVHGEGFIEHRKQGV